ncbi:unnamed protein product [Porites evermanni]|uniref:Uncharacterized protein n=1 Tax=Porites evermanni TaxID=104178 RepID=A0ABN8RRA1_9CNID|nr:unnamed protein product [Porites evermanni]
MQSKREPPSLLELSKFHRQKRENLLNGKKCIENQIHPIPERINTCNSQSSSNPGVLKDTEQPTDRQMASEDTECQNGISEQASRTGTIRVKDEYRRQRNGECYTGNEYKSNKNGPFNSERKGDMVDDGLNPHELSHSENHCHRTQRNGSECCMKNGGLNSTTLSSDHGCADKDEQRIETISDGSRIKILAERESRMAPFQQVSKQPAKEKNWLFIPASSAQPRLVDLQHNRHSGQPTRESTVVATEDFTGHPASKMRWIPIQPETFNTPRASGQRETETRLVLTNQISGHRLTESVPVAAENNTRQTAKTKMWTNIQHEPSGRSQIQNPSGQPARETRLLATQQTPEQLDKQVRRVHIQQNPGEPAKETTWVPIQQCSGQGVRKTKLVPIQQTLRQPGWVPTPPPAAKPPIKTRSQPTEQASSTLRNYKRLPPIQQTLDLNRPETRPPAVQETATSCQEPIRNEQSNESILARKNRRQGRQEAYPTRGFCPMRRQGVCRQTDGTEVQRTFVRVLNKRF